MGKKTFCIVCGKEIWKPALRCRSCSCKGKKLSEKHKEAISKGNIGKHDHNGKKNTMYGRHHSLETKKKISIANSTGIKRVRDIYSYVMFDKPYQVVFRQKIDETGKVQGIGKYEVTNVWERKNHIPISFPLNVPFAWHHIDEVHVVAIQKEIHEKIKHTLDGSFGILAKNLEGVLG